LARRDFPRSQKRGLIEVSVIVPLAAVSAHFPRSQKRGLIEVTRHHSHSSCVTTFPRSQKCGLIEVLTVDRIRRVVRSLTAFKKTMSFNMKTTKIFVGVDVSKATLDVFHPEKNEVVQIDNSDEVFGGFCSAIVCSELVCSELDCSELQKMRRQIMVIMVRTGDYEHLLVKHLACTKIEAAVINARRILDFAKGIGMDAKTDPKDAQVISKCAEVVVPKPIATKSDRELKHRALVARRNQLLEPINQENNLLTQSWDGASRLIPHS
jgi:hypothetical protein